MFYDLQNIKDIDPNYYIHKDIGHTWMEKEIFHSKRTINLVLHKILGEILSSEEKVKHTQEGIRND